MYMYEDIMLTGNVDFSLSQIFPVSDESEDAESRVAFASIVEPYVLIIKEDSSLMVLRADESGELEETETTEAISGTKWISGSLFNDFNDFFRLTSDTMEEDDMANVLAFLLTTEGGLQVSSYALVGNVSNNLRSSGFQIWKSLSTMPRA